VTVVVRRPGPPLDRLVRAITYQAGEQLQTSVEKILPDSSVTLWTMLNRGSAMLAGPRSRATVIEFEQGLAHVSVMFRLDAAASFLLPVAAVADELIPLELVWGRTGAALPERLLSARTPDEMLASMERALLAHLAGPLAPDPAMVAAAGALSGGMPVAKVAADLGLLERTLRRRFTAQTGLAPKRFARVQRLQRVVHALDGCSRADWATVAAAHGYSDQPHLADEFRDLAGVTPGEYLRSRVDGPNHLRV